MQLVLRKWFSQNLRLEKLSQYKRASTARTILNALGFQVGWFACVLGGDKVAVPVTVVLLVLHRTFFVNSSKEWWLIAGLAATGFIVDSLLTALGIFDFGNTETVLIPIWLFCLWLLFSATLCHSLSWLQHRLPLAIVMGSIAGPSSYFAGSKLASVTIAEPTILSLMIVGMCWAVVFPWSLLLARRYIK